MIQLLVTCFVAAALARFVMTSINDPTEEGNAELSQSAADLDLGGLEIQAHAKMIKMQKPDFVVACETTEQVVELPADFAPKKPSFSATVGSVIAAQTRDLAFCAAQDHDEPSRAPRPVAASSSNSQRQSTAQSVLQFFACSDQGTEEPATTPNRLSVNRTEAQGREDRSERIRAAEKNRELDEATAASWGGLDSDDDDDDEEDEEEDPQGPSSATLKADDEEDDQPTSEECAVVSLVKKKKKKKKKKQKQVKGVPRPMNELCNICFEASADAALFACGHVGLCYKCAISVYIRHAPCPFCRVKIEQIVTIDRHFPLYNNESRLLYRVTGPTLHDDLNSTTKSDSASSGPA